MSSLLNYKNSGVNIETGNNFINIIKNITKSEHIGGFSGVYECKNGTKLVASTDGVGSKLELCNILDKYDTIGIDLVAMCVNDIICQGATPLFFLDYYAMGKLNLDIASKIITGINEGCKQSNCLLLGGETAEMPITYKNDKHFDLAGFSVGIIENEIYPKQITENDLLFGLKSTGIHSNGYTLIHKILEKRQLDRNDEIGLHDLICPTKIYVDDVQYIINTYGNLVKGFAHITGGGLIDNIPRILDSSHNIYIDKTWNIPTVFKWIYNNSDSTIEDMFHTYNCGIGMVVILDKTILYNNTNIYNELIPLGKIVKSDKPFILYNNFNEQFNS
tara:strand:- start:1854 stop:2849 length:996 start_codon:yes stop_codon:yes gene_type:complete